MALVHILYFCATHFDIHVMITHIACSSNATAEALSHLQMCFKQLDLNAADLLDLIPAWPTWF